MKKKYLLSSDNGYHWNTSIMFDRIEDAIIYHINERIDDYSYEWVQVFVKEIIRPLESFKSHIEVQLLTVDNYGDKSNHLIYISEMTEAKPENKYNVTLL